MREGEITALHVELLLLSGLRATVSRLRADDWRRALADLCPADAAAVLLSVLHGLGQSEIADWFGGVTRTRAYQRLRRGLARVRTEHLIER